MNPSKPLICCFYCDKRCDTEQQLISHQKTVHFRCPICRHYQSSIQGLVYHTGSAHKEILTKVPGAIEGRDSPEIAVFGMKGIPEDVYVKWLTAFDPRLKDGATEINTEGTFIANEATRFAAIQHSGAASTIVFRQLAQFQRAAIPLMTSSTVVTAEGAISTEKLASKKIRHENPATTQRKMEAAMRRAQMIIEESKVSNEKHLKDETKERRRREVMFFTPEDNLSVFELRLKREKEFSAVPHDP